MDRTAWLLWGLACLLFVVGDMITTAIGIAQGATEANPMPALLIDRVGLIAGMAMLKLAAMVVILAGFSAVPEGLPREAIPGSLAVFGALIIAWNLAVVIAG